MKINEILKSLRQKKGLTQQEFAAELDINLSSYQKYERANNTITPSIEALIKIADFYGVSVDYLLGREPLANPLQGLNIGVEAVDSEKFIEAYDKLPDVVKQVFIDTMLKLSQAASER